MSLETIDATDQGRFSGARGPAYDDFLTSADPDTDSAQSLKFAKPFADGINQNHWLGLSGAQGQLISQKG
jgi:hypothetical protein